MIFLAKFKQSIRINLISACCLHCVMDLVQTNELPFFFLITQSITDIHNLTSYLKILSVGDDVKKTFHHIHLLAD